jgi:hypothetical protein
MVKPRPPLDPDCADEVSHVDGLTSYDMEHLVTYLRVLDAEADGADWTEVARIAMRARAEGGRTLKTCLVILLLNTPSRSRCRALEPPEVVGKSAKVDSGILCHSGQLERGTKTRIATLRAHVGADK